LRDGVKILKKGNEEVMNDKCSHLFQVLLPGPMNKPSEVWQRYSFCANKTR